jgi:uncharacterized damage-inducible protein DinB
MNPTFGSNRRRFLAGAALTAGMYGLNLAAQTAEKKTETDSGLYFIGPKPGYSPQVGTLVSMLTYIQTAVTRSVKGLTMADLDHLFDAKANSIGALLLHLAATETYYGMNKFENKKWGSWSDDVKKKWDPGMELGDAGRKEIKGHDLDYYLNVLHETREHSLAEFRKRDDQWLLSTDTEQFGSSDKINNYWKWFHVCEHESHHTGQIAFLTTRLPGAKAAPAGL